MDTSIKKNESDVALNTSTEGPVGEPHQAVIGPANCSPMVQDTGSASLASAVATVSVVSGPDSSTSAKPMGRIHRQEEVRASGSDSDSAQDSTIIDDGVSVCSQQSGMTEAGVNLQGIQLGDESGFVKLSHKDKKVFKSFMSKGLTREEALKAVKRSRSEEQPSDTGSSAKKSRTANTPTDKPSYGQVASGVKLGMISCDASKPLSAEHMAALKNAILQATLECKTPGCKPQFEGCVPRTDWLLIVCSSNGAADWLRANFEHIKAKCGLDVKLIEESSFPRAHLVRGYFPQSSEDTNVTVLGYLAAQNDLDTTLWKVIQREVKDTMLHLTFLVDNASWLSLQKCGGRVWFRFSKIRLVLKGSGPGDTKGPNKPAGSGQPKPRQPEGNTGSDDGPSSSKAVPAASRAKPKPVKPLAPAVAKKAAAKGHGARPSKGVTGNTTRRAKGAKLVRTAMEGQ